MRPSSGWCGPVEARDPGPPRHQTGRATVRTYGRLWLGWWGALGALGLLMGLATVPVAAVVGVFLTSAVVAGAVAVVPLVLDNEREVTAIELVRPAVGRGLPGALVVATVVVSSTVVGTLVPPLLVLAGLSSPWTLRWGLRMARRASARDPQEKRDSPLPEPARAPLDVSDWGPAIQALSDEELCWSWRASYTALQAAPSAASVELVTLRQAYLDDLERRNPRGMRAWLDSGARAAGNPARYLAADHPG